MLLILAERDGRPIAGALNLIGADTLYGRYWGCTEDVPFLHFELCYYQAIDAAIARGLATVEAGAQGEHKLARGYVPVPTWSAHYIPDRGFRRAIADFLARERAGRRKRPALSRRADAVQTRSVERIRCPRGGSGKSPRLVTGATSTWSTLNSTLVPSRQIGVRSCAYLGS